MTANLLQHEMGPHFVSGPAYMRRCVAARMVARQKAIDLAMQGMLTGAGPAMWLCLLTTGVYRYGGPP